MQTTLYMYKYVVNGVYQLHVGSFLKESGNEVKYRLTLQMPTYKCSPYNVVFVDACICEKSVFFS